LLQQPVALGHHALHDLGRRVPDAELLAEVPIEGREKRLIEVLHRQALVKGLEELLAVHPVQHVGGVAQRVF
jgi:hypothetical protein